MSNDKRPQGPKLVSDEGYILSSQTGKGGCVAVKITGNQVMVRDTKHPGGQVLKFDRKEWKAFIEGVKLGEFDA